MKQINRNNAIKLICKKKILSLDKVDRENHILNMWGIDNKDIVFISLSSKLKKELLSSEYPSEDILNSHYDELILLSLLAEFRGVTNIFISRKLLQMNLGKYSVYGEIEQLETCPCCSYNTLDSRGEYDICPLCHWEDDGTNDLNVYVGPNHKTLNEARMKFKKIKKLLFDIKNQKYCSMR